jgi:predicted O-linked N-acetylglucosamine transferase (SPINDLY family)
VKDDFRVQFELGRALEAHKAGDLDRAERGYRSVLRARPRQFDALHMLALIHQARGRLDAALRSINEALAVAPNVPEALSNRATVRRDLGDAAGALADADQAIAAKPAFAAAHTNRANALVLLRRLEDALASYDKAIACDPFLAVAWSGRSLALNRLRRLKEAETSARRALDLNPMLADAWTNLGLAHYEAGNSPEGIPCFERALAIDPSHAHALYGRGSARLALGRHDDALIDLQAARRRQRFDGDDGQLFQAMINICSWTELDGMQAQIADSIVAGAIATTPFATLGLFDDPQLHQRIARTFAAAFYPAVEMPDPPAGAPAAEVASGDDNTRKRVRLAYLSADYRPHPISFLIVDTLERHDRDRFEIVGLSQAKGEDTLKVPRVREAFDRFFHVRDLSDDQLASFIAELNVDILVDLTGFTFDSRTGALARRPAPIQVNFLGYPGTMGAPYYDYLIADGVVVSDPSWFDEALCLLPDTYQPNSVLPAAAPTMRSDHGLPDDAFVFCSFCNNWKIMPDVFAIWMRLLAKTPGSVLWLLANNAGVVDNLRREAGAAGIDPQRLIFALRVSHAEHIARHALADLMLDTFPYGAHTTASDALWMGVPLVTRSGQAFQTRVARSVLRAAGLERFAVETVEEYEALALALANQPDALRDARVAVAQARQSALFDSQRFVRNLEAGYLAMVARAAAGLAPDRIEVASVE